MAALSLTTSEWWYARRSHDLAHYIDVCEAYERVHGTWPSPDSSAPQFRTAGLPNWSGAEINQQLAHPSRTLREDPAYQSLLARALCDGYPCISLEVLHPRYRTALPKSAMNGIFDTLHLPGRTPSERASATQCADGEIEVRVPWPLLRQAAVDAGIDLTLQDARVNCVPLRAHANAELRSFIDRIGMVYGSANAAVSARYILELSELNKLYVRYRNLEGARCAGDVDIAHLTRRLVTLLAKDAVLRPYRPIRHPDEDHRSETTVPPSPGGGEGAPDVLEAGSRPPSPAPATTTVDGPRVRSHLRAAASGRNSNLSHSLPPIPVFKALGAIDPPHRPTLRFTDEGVAKEAMAHANKPSPVVPRQPLSDIPVFSVPPPAAPSRRSGGPQRRILDDGVRSELAMLEPVGSSLILPDSPLSHHHEIAKLIEHVGGSLRDTGSAFDFPERVKPGEVLTRLLGGDTTQFRKGTHTPPTTAQRASDLCRDADVGPNQRVLVARAGNGAITDAARSRGADVVAVEPWNVNAQRLRNKGHHVLEADFLAVSPDEIGTFDAILSELPYRSNRDISYVEHMVSFLKPGGTISVVMAMSGRSADFVRAREFEDFLARHAAEITRLEDDGRTDTVRITLRDFQPEAADTATCRRAHPRP